MSEEVKTQRFIDVLLQKKQELIDAAKHPFIRQQIRRALESGRDNLNLEVITTDLKIQTTLENIEQLGANLGKILDQQEENDRKVARIKNIEALYLKLFNKAMKPIDSGE